MANDITILSCPQCGFPKIRDVGNGLYQCDDCGTHFDKNENIVQTNEEWLKQCNTEQLAGFLSKVGELDEAPIPCGDLMECSKNCGLYSQCAGDDVMPTNEEIWVEWLKQPNLTSK